MATNFGQNLCLWVHSREWRSETDCDIATLIQKCLMAIRYLHPCARLIKIGQVTPRDYEGN